MPSNVTVERPDSGIVRAPLKDLGKGMSAKTLNSSILLWKIINSKINVLGIRWLVGAEHHDGWGC